MTEHAPPGGSTSPDQPAEAPAKRSKPKRPAPTGPQPFLPMERRTTFRTSDVTNDAIRAQAWEVEKWWQAQGPGGARRRRMRYPFVDAVLFAAMRLVDTDALIAEIDKIDQETFIVPPR